MANAFLHRIENARQDGLRAGLEIGFQMAADFISIAANDPECIGKNNALGEERLIKILAGAKNAKSSFCKPFVRQMNPIIREMCLTGNCNKYSRRIFARLKNAIRE